MGVSGGLCAGMGGTGKWHSVGRPIFTHHCHPAEGSIQTAGGKVLRAGAGPTWHGASFIRKRDVIHKQCSSVTQYQNPGVKKSICRQ
jgi:hypothetical protein